MTISVVACGNSAKEWYKTPCDLSIGVNDCFKFGHQTNHLVLVNSPLAFQPNRKNNMVNRLEIIKQSKPQRAFVHNRNWKPIFPHAEMIRMRPFHNEVRVRPDIYYCSKTSPFVAISAAFTAGANQIVLWGVDMKNHPHYSPGKKYFDSELQKYLAFFKALEKHNVKLYIGNENTVLKHYLPIYQL